MNSNLEKALDLAKQQKFKKALVIIKKVNQKTADISFQTMELEALCLFKAKSYQMARIKMEKALTFSSNSKEELTTLKNLAAIYDKLKMQDKVLSTLTQLVELDKGFTFVRERLSLVELALELGEHNIVKQYAPNILKFRELSIGAMICLAKSALIKADNETALTYLTMAEGEIRSDGALIAVDKLNISMNQIILVLDGYHQLKAFSKEQRFLNFLSKKYLQHEWYQTTQKRLDNSKNKTPATKPQKANEESVPTKSDRVTGQNIQVVKLIEDLVKELENMGAEFHKGLRIEENNGDLSVYCSLPVDNKERLMHVPLTCMPLLSDYKFELSSSGLLIAKTKKNAINPAAYKIMDMVVALYNSTNKLSWWKTQYPLFLLSGQTAVVDKLMQAKSHSAKYRSLYAETFDAITDDSLIQSFLGSRSFSFNKDYMRKVGIKMKNPREQGLIPLIELINHNVLAPPFVYDKGCHYLDTFINKGPANQEAFVQYNLDDPLLTFLQYGFVDTSAPWIYSVPMTLNTLTGKRIHIQSILGNELPINLPENLKAVAQYVPQQCTRQGDDIVFSSLIIPGKTNTPLLKTVLSYLLTKIDTELHYSNQINLEQELNNLEYQLIETNKILARTTRFSR